MICNNCKSSNTRVEIVQDKIKHKDKGMLAKLGRIFLIIYTLGFWLLVPKKKGTSKIKNKKVLICNDCGHIKEID